jgi:hypothetical protein
MRVFGGSIAGSQSFIADDTAANYTSFSMNIPYISPASGGYGFANWTNTAQNNGGIFRGGVAGGFGNINTGGNSFGAYGNNTNGGLTDGVNIGRNLNNALSVGFALSGVMAVKYRGGNKGFVAYSDTNFSTEIFNVNVGGDNYSINNVVVTPTVNYCPNMVISIVLSQITTTTFNWSVNFRGIEPNTTSVNRTVTNASPVTGVVRGFKHYIFECPNLTPGEPNNDNNNLYYNSYDVYRF